MLDYARSETDGDSMGDLRILLWYQVAGQAKYRNLLRALPEQHGG